LKKKRKFFLTKVKKRRKEKKRNFLKDRAKNLEKISDVPNKGGEEGSLWIDVRETKRGSTRTGEYIRQLRRGGKRAGSKKKKIRGHLKGLKQRSFPFHETIVLGKRQREVKRGFRREGKKE